MNTVFNVIWLYMPMFTVDRNEEIFKFSVQDETKTCF